MEILVRFTSKFEGEVEAFPSQLRQVFTNVIKNGVEATHCGEQNEIDTKAAEQSGEQGVLLRVMDSGPAITAIAVTVVHSICYFQRRERYWAWIMGLPQHSGKARYTDSY